MCCVLGVIFAAPTWIIKYVLNEFFVDYLTGSDNKLLELKRNNISLNFTSVFVFCLSRKEPKKKTRDEEQNQQRSR